MIEQRIVGALLKEPRLIDTAEQVHGLTPDMFSDETCRRIFEVIGDRARRGLGVDVVSVAEVMENDRAAIAEIFAEIVTTAHAPDWMRMLKEEAAKRRIADICREYEKAAQLPDADPVKLCEAMTGEIEAARVTANGRHVPTLAEAASEIRKTMIEAPPCLIPLFPPGTEGRECANLRAGEIFVLGAVTGSGKTALCAGAVLEQLKAGFCVAYFCSESNSSDILARIAAAMSGVPHYLPDRSNDAIQRFRGALDILKTKYAGKLHIVGNDCGPITPGTIRRHLRAIDATGAAQVVYVDFLQNVSPDRRGRTSLEEINSTIQALHDTLAEHRAAGVLVSQFNRSSITAARSGKGSARPTLEWLKDTSTLEQLAATVAFLWRTAAASGKEETTYFYSEKTRNCRPFCIPLTWGGTAYVSRGKYDF